MPSFAMHTALSIPLAWGLYSLIFLQRNDLTLDLVNPFQTKSIRYLSLSVDTSMFKPPTPISLRTEAIDLISFSRSPVMTTIPNIPVWIIKITKTLQYFPSWTIFITTLMSTTPGRSPPTCLYTRDTAVRPMSACFMLPQKVAHQLGLFKLVWKIWFRFLRNNFFPFS